MRIPLVSGVTWYFFFLCEKGLIKAPNAPFISGISRKNVWPFQSMTRQALLDCPHWMYLKSK